MWVEPLPEGVDAPEGVRLCIQGDLHTDGTFGRQWLVVGRSRLWVYGTENGAVVPRWDLAFDTLEEPKAENFVGGGALEVGCDGRRIELIRYTNARTPKFAAAGSLLAKWIKGEEAELPEEEERRCGQCGMPLPEGTRVCAFCLSRRRTLGRLLGYLKPYWKQAAGLSLLATATTALGLVPPYLQKPLMDRVLAPVEAPLPLDQRLGLLALLVLALLVARVLMAGLGALQGWLSAWLGNRITHDIRCQLYAHLQHLSLRFFDKREMGSVISRVNQDTGHLHGFLVWGSQDLTIDLLLIVGIGVMLFAMNWRLALVVFVPAPIVAFVSVRFWRRIRRYFRRFFHRWSQLNTVLSQTLNGLRIVKAFAQEPREVTRFQDRSYDLAVSGVHAERMWAFLFSGMSLLIVIGSLLVWYVGGRGVLLGDMTLGTLVAFLTYVGMFYQPIQSMSVLLNWSSRALAAAERVFEVLETPPETRESDDAVPLSEMEGRVEFKEVTFGYDRHRPVLKHVSLDIAAGEMIGLVGHSGAGKSTTINLICRFYDVDEGELRIDGLPIRRIRLEDLRRHIGLVPQDTFLFTGTIAENIAYAKHGATREEIVRAAKVANAHEFIVGKPEGYETLIGEGGEGLSAGERQRMAIARAVLHNPRILILDEATSNVDVETEKQIQQAIARLIEGRTTIAIAHRLATLRNASRLVVLKDGEIVEVGTHEELMAKDDGEFHKLATTYQEISQVRAVEG